VLPGLVAVLVVDEPLAAAPDELKGAPPPLVDPPPELVPDEALALPDEVDAVEVSLVEEAEERTEMGPLDVEVMAALLDAEVDEESAVPTPGFLKQDATVRATDRQRAERARICAQHIESSNELNARNAASCCRS
jgi:hypothetical protein